MAFLLISKATICTPSLFRLVINRPACRWCSQAIHPSAPSAVLEISLRGGVAVYPHRKTLSTPKTSAQRKSAPTLYRLRILLAIKYRGARFDIGITLYYSREVFKIKLSPGWWNWYTCLPAGRHAGLKNQHSALFSLYGTYMQLKVWQTTIFTLV